MAAQQPPPNWVAFSAASRRVSQSTTQIVQALQASANIPADIATMSSELEQLEHQPTNAALQQQVQQMQQQMQQQFTALNHNMTARILNSTLQSDTDQLAPLIEPQTSAPIANFPANSAALSSLSWAQKRALGIKLAINDPGVNPNAAARSNFFTQLRITIGLKPRPA